MKNLLHQSTNKKTAKISTNQNSATLKAEQWLKENKNAIQAYNDVIQEHGMFGDEYRSF